MSGSRLGINQLNGNSSRRPPPPPNVSRMSSTSSTSSSSSNDNRSLHAQHDDLIKYIYDSWTKVEMDRGSNNVVYYTDDVAHHLKDFQPFDLEAYWGRRLHHQQQPHS